MVVPQGHRPSALGRRSEAPVPEPYVPDVREVGVASTKIKISRVEQEMLRRGYAKYVTALSGWPNDPTVDVLARMKAVMDRKREEELKPKIETSADVSDMRKIHRIYSHGRAIADFRGDGTYHLLVDVMDLMEMGGFPRALAQIVLDKVSEGYALAVETAIQTLEEAGYGEAAKVLRAHADREARKAAGLEPSAS